VSTSIPAAPREQVDHTPTRRLEYQRKLETDRRKAAITRRRTVSEGSYTLRAAYSDQKVVVI
jgi:hypothetical protein